MNATGQGKRKLKTLAALALTAVIALIGVVALSRAPLTVTLRVLKANGPIRKLHATLWVWPEVESITPKDSAAGAYLALLYALFARAVGLSSSEENTN